MHSISSQAKRQRQAKVDAFTSKAVPACNVPLDPIPEFEDTYDSGGDTFQSDQLITTFISSFTGGYSDTEIVADGSGSDEEIDIDVSPSGTDDDIGNSTCSEDLDEAIMQRIQRSKPMVAWAPTKLKRQPGRPKGSSKPALTEQISDDEPETHCKLLSSKCYYTALTKFYLG